MTSESWAASFLTPEDLWGNHRLGWEGFPPYPGAAPTEAEGLILLQRDTDIWGGSLDILPYSPLRTLCHRTRPYYQEFIPFSDYLL